MKKMTSIAILSSLLFMFSCSPKENTAVENPESIPVKTQKQQEDETILNGPSLYLAIAKAKGLELQTRQVELAYRVEKGDEEAVKELEKTQEELHKIKRISKIYSTSYSKITTAA